MSLYRFLKRLVVVTPFFFFAIVLAQNHPQPASQLQHPRFRRQLQQQQQQNDSGSTIVQLHVITRHGSRTMLSKDADDLTEKGGATLTPLGMKQLYDLGVWIRQTYNVEGFGGEGGEGQNRTSSSSSNIIQSYNPAFHRLESSDFDRTISSANAFSAGLFPVSTPRPDLHGGVDGVLPTNVAPSVPVYSVQNDNDIYLRAFRHCPTFHDRLQRLYKSDSWMAIENGEDVQPLLQKLGRIFAGNIDSINGTVPLKRIWNAYDQIHVARTECTTTTTASSSSSSSSSLYTGPDSFSCQSLPDPTLATVLSQTEFDRLERLTEETEGYKFGIDTAGNLIGSNLLWKMIDRAKESEGTFFLYSAHAPTILGLLSTLQADYQGDVNERFIEYGSALILEVHQHISSNDVDDSTMSQKYIKLKYKSSIKDDAIDITLKQYSGGSNESPCGHDDLQKDNTQQTGSSSSSSVLLDSSAFCSLQQFVVWARMKTLDSVEEWCDACGNDSSDQCMEAILVEEGIVNRGDSDSTTAESTDAGGANVFSQVLDTAKNDPAVIAATFFGGVITGLLCVAIVYCACTCRRRKVEKTKQDYDERRIQKDLHDDEKTEVVVTSHFSNGGQITDPTKDNAHVSDEKELL